MNAVGSRTEDGDGKPKKKKGELTYDFENLEEPDETRFTLRRVLYTGPRTTASAR